MAHPGKDETRDLAFERLKESELALFEGQHHVTLKKLNAGGYGNAVHLL